MLEPGTFQLWGIFFQQLNYVFMVLVLSGFMLFLANLADCFCWQDKKICNSFFAFVRYWEFCALPKRNKCILNKKFKSELLCFIEVQFLAFPRSLRLIIKLLTLDGGDVYLQPEMKLGCYRFIDTSWRSGRDRILLRYLKNKSRWKEKLYLVLFLTGGLGFNFSMVLIVIIQKIHSEYKRFFQI